MFTRKTYKTLGWGIAVILGTIIILRLMGGFQNYTMFSTVMEPTLKKGSRVIASNIPNHHVGKLVIVRHNDSLRGKGKSTYRLVGAEYDTIEIKDGVFYRNGKNIDKNMALAHAYAIPVEIYHELRNKNQIVNDQVSRLVSKDTAIVQLSTNVAKSNNLENNRFIQSVKNADEDIQKQYGHPWNKNNFGPVVIPKNSFFILGDNRDDSFDSRYTGFIKRKDIIGTVIFYW